MFTSNDEKLMADRGITRSTVDRQLQNYKSGFPFLKIADAATIENGGIIALDESQADSFVKIADEYDGSVCKFVPASGAASRMFKDLFAALSNLKEGKSLEQTPLAEKFVENICKFPFFDARHLLEFTLSDKALNYGSMPKGLVEFHSYPDGNRTPLEEHLVEGALYAKDKNGVVKMVFTVSKEHRSGFEQLFESVKEKYQKRFGCKYDVEFTLQSPSTDMIAVDGQNNPFRTETGELLFRPAGHGALLQNINEIKSDVIVVKNIDNVVKEKFVAPTVYWKKVLIGAAVALSGKCREYLSQIADKSEVPAARLEELKEFLHRNFSVDLSQVPEDELLSVIKSKLDRPVRVCGMVRNEGEPGGGPYIIRESAGTTSLQILESAQIDKADPAAMAALEGATHFNPVDLVCTVYDYKGDKFDLAAYSDPSTGFISEKSYQGRKLKAQELPGLWNGAMSNWNTQFIEVPLITFNPVKTVVDLLRETHQG